MSYEETAPVYLSRSPLHGEGLFARRDFSEGELIFTHWDAVTGLIPPTWKANSSLVLDRPPSGIDLPDLVRMLVIYKVNADRAANVSLDKVGATALRDINRGEEILYAYCPLTWLVEYIDEEPLLETRLNYVRALHWEHSLRIPNCAAA